MAKKPRAGNSYKTQYKAYTVKGQWRKNKIAKLTKRALINENDTIALEVFEKGSKTYGRGKPGNKGWFHPQEQKLLRDISNEVEGAKEKLASLKDVYTDKRPTAIKGSQPAAQAESVVDQLCRIGVISEKRRRTFKTRYHKVSRR